MELPTEKTTTATAELRDYITLYYGPPGVGKTTFVNGLGERVLFLSTDRGTRTQDALRIECFEWADFQKANELLQKPKAPKYDFVCVDHVDDMCRMAEEYVCDQAGVAALSDLDWGKGYKAYKTEIDRFIRGIMSLGNGVVFICHETIKTIRTRSLETERTMPDLNKTGWKMIVPMCDLIGYCGFTTVKVPGTKSLKEVRSLDTVPKESLYTKDRTKRLKPGPGQYELLDAARFTESFSAISSVGEGEQLADTQEGVGETLNNPETGEDKDNGESTSKTRRPTGRRGNRSIR